MCEMCLRTLARLNQARPGQTKLGLARPGLAWAKPGHDKAPGRVLGLARPELPRPSLARPEQTRASQA